MKFKNGNLCKVILQKNNYVAFAFLFFITSIYSCVSTLKTKDASGVAYTELIRNAKESEGEVFVVTPDGVKHSGTKIKWPPKYFSTSQPYIQIDETKYPNKKHNDILAWQDENSYNIHYGSPYETAARVVKGKINLYKYYKVKAAQYADGRTRADNTLHLLLEKDKFQFIDATYSNVDSLLANNTEVLQKFHELYPEGKKKTNKYPHANSYKSIDAWHNNMIMLVQMYNK